MIHDKQVVYPESDGKPMGETDLHRNAMIRHIEMLQDHFKDQQVYVTGDLLLYYEEGNPHKFIVPDAFIAKGLAPQKRRVYKTWVEGKSPDLVIETTSRKTRRKDMNEKRELYAKLGVREYFLLDPERDYLDPPLQGFRLDGSTFVPIVPDEMGGLVSEELQLILREIDDQLVFFGLDSSERLLTRAERADRATQRADREMNRAEREARRADREAHRADNETNRANLEADARRAAEEELAKLREELARLRGTS